MFSNVSINLMSNSGLKTMTCISIMGKTSKLHLSVGVQIVICREGSNCIIGCKNLLLHCLFVCFLFFFNEFLLKNTFYSHSLMAKSMFLYFIRFIHCKQQERHLRTKIPHRNGTQDLWFVAISW